MSDPAPSAVVPPVVLTIAGSDPSGGAGLAADLRTIAAHGFYGAAVPTALTVQNTRGVTGVQLIDADLVAAQIAAVLEDLPIAAIKVGMLGSAGIARAVLDAVVGPVVLDPVLRSSSGAVLLDADGLAVLRGASHRLALITPNLAEAAALLGGPVDDPRAAAEALRDLLGCPVLVTGGHGPDPTVCVDWLAAEALVAIEAPRVATVHDHGTGCLLSTAIACALAAGLGVLAAVQHGRACVTAGLEHALPLGAGTGPVFLLRAPTRSVR